MRDGFYRLQYDAGVVTGSGVIAFHDGVLSGCTPFHFLHGTYKKKGNSLEGVIEFELHTQWPGQPAVLPSQFAVRFTGLSGSNYGQAVFSSPDAPQFKGSAKFSWLGEYQ